MIRYFLFISRSQEDDLFDLSTKFYLNVNRYASVKDLLGTWAILNLEFNEKFPVPVNYEYYGRDYLVLFKKEFI